MSYGLEIPCLLVVSALEMNRAVGCGLADGLPAWEPGFCAGGLLVPGNRASSRRCSHPGAPPVPGPVAFTSGVPLSPVPSPLPSLSPHSRGPGSQPLQDPDPLLASFAHSLALSSVSQTPVQVTLQSMNLGVWPFRAYR